MPTPVVFALGVLLAALLAAPVRAGKRGAALPHAARLNVHQPAAHTLLVGSGVAQVMLPDTTRRPTPADTTRRPALVPDTTAVPPDEEKPTRKTTLLTVLAIAVLTVSTLLLYNVRSR